MPPSFSCAAACPCLCTADPAGGYSSDDSPDEFSSTGTPAVAYSNIQGGWPGTGNIDADPLFVDPVNGDYHLLAGSPCIDGADNIAVPVGIDTDLDGNPRFVDDPDTPDTGNPGPPGPIVDMGAYELQLLCPQDITSDGFVNVLDLIQLLLCFGNPASPPCDTGQDVNGDGDVNVLDLIDVLLAFATRCP